MTIEIEHISDALAGIDDNDEARALELDAVALADD